MSTYLLEIGTEELPAKFAHSVIEQFQSILKYEFEKHCVSYSQLTCTSTPRRIVLYLQGLVDFGNDKTELRKGPKAEVAYAQGIPTNAAKGFAKSLNLDVEDLEIKKTDKGEFVFGVKTEKGLSTKKLISTLLPKTIKVLQGQRFMKWGNGSFRFSRPIRWILSLYNNEILDLRLEEIDSNLKIGNLSRGHRLFNSNIQIKSPDEYFGILKKNGVIVDRHERRNHIINSINTAATNLGLFPDLNEELINELTDLVESPNLIIGSFSEEYLTLPTEVLCTVMKSHQRYIPLFKTEKIINKLAIDSKDYLSTNFLCISNGLNESNEIIKKGNEKVLKARFADAKFFVEADKRISSSERNLKIKNISYLNDIGNVSDRVSRIFHVAKKIYNSIDNAALDLKIIEDSSKLSKNDLCSEIVYEFPELQGLMGGKYLKNEGFDDEISLAVSEQYLPRFNKDEIPSSKYGAILSIADKLETVISIYVIGKRPSGSSDPFALRRNLNGILQIIWHYNFDFDLELLIISLIDYWRKSLSNLDFDSKKVKGDLIQFVFQRNLSFLEDLSIEKDWIKAIANSKNVPQNRVFNLIEIKKRINIFKQLNEEKSFDELRNIISRICKLANSGTLKINVLSTKGLIDKDLFEKDSEDEFFKFIKNAELIIFSQKWTNEELTNLFYKNLEVLSNIFDNQKGVMIISENAKMRINRLNLLGLVRNYSYLIADFTCINS